MMTNGRNGRCRRTSEYFRRCISLLLCLCMMLPMFSSVTSFTVSAAVSASADVDPRYVFEYNHPNALHFYIRHWHSEPVEGGTQFQSSSTESVDRHFVVGDGYIVPDEETGAAPYAFYFVYQDDMGGTQQKGSVVRVYNVSASDYIESIDPATGSIVLKSHPVDLSKKGENERFSCFSISAGHDAIASYADDAITITYRPDVHLVKGHAFYVRESSVLMHGTDDSSVFGTTEGGIADNPQVDTMLIYTYTGTDDFSYTHDDGESKIYRTGDIVMKKSSSAVACDDKDELPDGLYAENIDASGQYHDINVSMTKFYSTTVGLHTDKTAKPVGTDGRTFDLTLESWYTEKAPPSVTMVLDASGSMGFASDVPEPINVYNHALLSDDQKAFLKAKSDKITEWGAFTKTDIATFPQKDNILGYYEFSQNSSGLNRNWYLNSKKHAPTTTYSDLNESYFAKFVLHSDDKSIIDFTNYTTLIASTDGGYSGWGDVPAKFSAASGMYIASKEQASAMLLDVAPAKSDNFTLSFSLQQFNADPTDADIEILYIGARKGLRSDTDYFHVIRRGNDIVASIGGQDTPVITIPNGFTSAEKHTIVFVFEGRNVTTYWDGSPIASTQITPLPDEVCVAFAPFADDNVQDQYFAVDSICLYDTALDADDAEDLSVMVNAASGLDSQIANKTSTAFLNETELALILNPHNTDYSKLSGSGYSYFVYDPRSTTEEYTPLTYWDGISGSIPGTLANVSGRGWYYSSYSSANFVVNGSGTSKTARGLSNSKESLTFTDTIYPDIAFDDGNCGAAPDVTQKFNIDPIKGNSDVSYTITFTDGSPSQFYIDKEGYLRCFFSPTMDVGHTSYVYELDDLGYVKTETLQRALGDFATRLDEKSPLTKVSAVRFSLSASNVGNNMEKLVLLDWTDDSAEAATLLSLKRAASGTPSKSENPLLQYNYGLTGGTYTMTGLTAVKDYLSNKEKLEEIGEGDRYLIIFTDGADSDAAYIRTSTGSDQTSKLASANNTIKLANQLKAPPYNYTIFTVLLNGGPVKEGGEQYADAHNYLLALAGDKSYVKSSYEYDIDNLSDAVKEYNAYAEDFFFSIDKAKGETENYDPATMNDSDLLTQIFANQILDGIVVDRKDYNVQDYIDPRFDLMAYATEVSQTSKITPVSGQKYLIRLKADGNVVFAVPSASEDEHDVIVATYNLRTGRYTLSDYSAQANWSIPIRADENDYYLNIGLMTDTIEAAKTPRLRYDADSEMYYLEWVKQLIPGFTVGATTLSVWRSTFTLRAKADFIGGNMVLTNGNREYMNYVYDPTVDKSDTSSGTNFAIPQDDDASPSKGFPRVTVNVGMLDLSIGTNEDRLYLGEVVNPTLVINGLGETIAGDHYWTDYLMRYAPTYIQENGIAIDGDINDLTPDQLMDIILKALADDPSGKGLEIRYYYLPNIISDDDGNRLPSDNQPGLQVWQQSDQLGILRYRWERLDPATGEVIGVGGYTDPGGKDNGSAGTEEDDVTSGPYKGKTYETLDTRRIEYRLVISYWPYPDNANDFWTSLNDWNNDPENDYAQTAGSTKSNIQTILDDMWNLLGASADSGDTGLSVRVQNADVESDMNKYITPKYNEIEAKLNQANFPTIITSTGTFNSLLDEVYDALYTNDTFVNIKTTSDSGEDIEKITIPNGLQGLLNALDTAKKDTTSKTRRVYLEAALFNLRNEIDNKITHMINYIDYLRWCYGYGDTGWINNNDKFNRRAEENHKLITDVIRTKDVSDGNGGTTCENVENTNGFIDYRGVVPQYEYAYWTPKDAVGDTQYNKTAIGMHTTRVVRGELAFELEIPMEDLTCAFDYGVWNKSSVIPYYVTLKRDYTYPDDEDLKTENSENYENQKWDPAIPELKIDIKYADLERLTAFAAPAASAEEPETEAWDWENGDYKEGDMGVDKYGVVTIYYTSADGSATEYPKTVYYPEDYTGDASKRGIVIYYSDPRVFDPVYAGYTNNKDYARLLPIGTYTMKPAAKNETLWSKFGVEMFYASDENYTFDSWHFTRTTKEGEPNNNVESIYFPRSGRSQTLGLGQLKAPEPNRKKVAGTDDYYPDGRLINTDAGVIFQLGTKAYSSSDRYSGSEKDIPQYTDDRVGMMKLTVSLQIYEPPGTGGPGLLAFYLWGTGLLLLGGVCLIALKLRREEYGNYAS